MVKKKNADENEDNSQSKPSGTPTMSQEEYEIDWYEILEVHSSASKEDIRKSYKKLSMIWHPGKYLLTFFFSPQHWKPKQICFQIKTKILQERINFKESIKPTRY